ncbi:MAG: zinc-binding dehydrogenase [Acidimicrobiales bacterium]
MARVKEATAGRGADVVYDPVGGDTFDASRRCLAFEGRLVTVGFTSGRIPEAPANHVLLKNYSVVGVHLDQYYAWAPKAVQECHDDLVRLHAEGRIDPLVAHRHGFDEAPHALTSLGTRATRGKVVLTA